MASNNAGKPTNAAQLRVLYGEGDAEVLAAQAVSIQKAGHQVQTAVGRKGIDEAVQKGTFDLIILGPTLSRNDRHHLPYVIKKVQPTRILVMHTDGERHPAVDANTDTGRGMADVVTKITSLMGSNSQTGSSKAAAAGK
jgi:DNA-binding NtrC family response regulator